MKKILYTLCILLPMVGIAQTNLNGLVLEATETNAEIPIAGANVYWLNTTVGAVTDFDGAFSIPYQPDYKKLIISYVGYKTDTLTVQSANPIKHRLQPTSALDEVVLSARKQATAKSYLQSQNIMVVSSEELLKAACCNLSESFETNPSIDVNFADAVSGTRQIKMLGLTSPYILIATENVPAVRGAAQAYGLSFIPGTWVESIQITKGAGSVTNGFESIAGQINAELVKPTTDLPVFVNVYAGSNERLELNTHLNTQVSSKWDTGLYVHGSTQNKKHDSNGDSFMDMPTYNQVNIMNRWQYTNPEKGFVGFVNLKYLNDDKQMGQIDFNPKTDRGTTNAWGSEIDTRRYEIATKLGYVNPEIPYKTIGVQTAFSRHEQDSYFGLNTYDIAQNSLYVNAIYNTLIGDTRHKVKTGLSYTYDHYDEFVNTQDYERTETSVGGFFEYTYDNLSSLNVSAGIRVDQHNLFGFFITPRLHARYTPWHKSAFRASVGRGKRSANIFTENQQIFATSRTINIANASGDIYGLDPEIAWNYGLSYLQGFTVFGRQGDFTLDYYRTDFENQIVVDYENPRTVNFSNLQGSSFANSFQAEVNYNVLPLLDVRLAYKYYDVQTDYQTGTLEKPLTAKHRFFANAGYQTRPSDKGALWKFDATYNWLSKQRFSSTQNNPVAFQLPTYTPTVGTVNMQVTKVFSPKFEVYLGGENVTNVKQNNPILAANDPFGPNFDSTFVYGPIFGSMYYAGLRFKVN
ncbi:TonB-dependent receptor domain-containing protein [Bizionia sediminis]|uniref:TonB-dependent receptor domain-containing protein n=1 Tax=Bizionia sediminis TaxID=1737064 RepID=A0ABW5KUN8_9FLAO